MQKQTQEDKLRVIIQRQKTESFYPKYRAQATDEEGLGLLISHYFEWAIEPIIKTAYQALEDANAHSFNADLLELAKKHGFEVE